MLGLDGEIILAPAQILVPAEGGLEKQRSSGRRLTAEDGDDGLMMRR